MKSLRGILVGIDFSPASDNALREAERIATWNGASLIALHVVDAEELGYHRSRDEFHPEALRETIRKRLLQHAGGIVTDPGNLVAEVAIGHPLEEVLKARHAHDCGMIALGSQGRESEEDRVGPLASQCLRKAPATVFLARAWNGEPYSSVTVCVDFSDTSKKAVETAIHIALQDQASLEILHAVRPLTASYGDFATPAGLGMFEVNLPPFPDFDPVKNAHEHLASFLEPFAQELATLQVNRHIVEAGRPASAILDRLQESGSDLIVMGTRGRTGLKRLLLGTTAERVLKQAPCSAIAVKPDDFSYGLD